MATATTPLSPAEQAAPTHQLTLEEFEATPYFDPIGAAAALHDALEAALMLDRAAELLTSAIAEKSASSAVALATDANGFTEEAHERVYEALDILNSMGIEGDDADEANR